MTFKVLLALFGFANADWIWANQKQGEIRIGDEKINTAEINEEMRHWDKFFSNRQNQEDIIAAAQGFGNAMNRAKARLDVEGARLFKPIMDFTRAYQQSQMIGDDCDYDQMFQCYVKKPNQSLVRGACARAYDCFPNHNKFLEEDNMKNASSQIQGVYLDIERKIQRDVDFAMKEYRGNTQRLGVSLAKEMEQIMVQAYKCNADCTHNFTSRITFNPIEAWYTCGCIEPIEFDMSTALLQKSPDMELYRLMKVDTSHYDFSLLFKLPTISPPTPNMPETRRPTADSPDVRWTPRKADGQQVMNLDDWVPPELDPNWGRSLLKSDDWVPPELDPNWNGDLIMMPAANPAQAQASAPGPTQAQGPAQAPAPVSNIPDQPPMAPAIMMPKAGGDDDNTTPIIMGVLMIGIVGIGVAVCICNKKREKSLEEEHGHEGGHKEMLI